MEAPPKVHRHHRHRRTNSRRRHEDNNVTNERRSSTDQPNDAENIALAAGAGAVGAGLSAPGSSGNRTHHHHHHHHNQQQQHQQQQNSQNLEQPSLLVNGHEPQYEEDEGASQQNNIVSATINGLDSNNATAGTDSERKSNNDNEAGGTSTQATVATPSATSALATSKHDERHLHKGILGFMDRELKTTTGLGSGLGGGKKLQSFSDPQASPAQRSTRSRSSLDKSPRRKRSKSESRRRRERKLIAAGEMEVRQANETLMRYLKQCSEMNDASLSGELEIDHSFDERRVHRKTKSQRDKRGHLLGRTGGNGLSSILRDLSEDIVPNSGEIYNPFTPVVSPTEGPPSRIDKMFIQTSTGYRPVDHCFYKNSIGSDPESNKNDILTSVNLSCALQRIWIMVSNICHGLLGGLALAHLLFIATNRPYDWADGAIRHYSSFAEIYANTFYCLAIVCMVSIFDRMDICHIDITNAPEIISFRWVIITMIYIATIILTLCAESMDEKLYLTNYNITILESEMENNQVLSVWNSLSIARSMGAIIGWIMIGLSSTSDDLLYTHLIEMEKYQLTNN